MVLCLDIDLFRILDIIVDSVLHTGGVDQQRCLDIGMSTGQDIVDELCNRGGTLNVRQALQLMQFPAPLPVDFLDREGVL